MGEARIAPPKSAKENPVSDAQTALFLDKDSVRPMRNIAIVFLIFYILIIGSKLFSDYKSEQVANQAKHLTYTQSVAKNISTNLNNTIIWINNGLSEGQNPAQSARIIAKYPNIEFVLILDANNNAIAGYPKTAYQYSSVAAQDMKNDTIKITSITEANGKKRPVVIKKVDGFITMAALSDNFITQTQSLHQSLLIAPPGQIITGNTNDLSLDMETIKLLSTKKTSGVTSYKLRGVKTQLTNVPIPHSNMVLLEAHAAHAQTSLWPNLVVFSVLFLVTCALIWHLLGVLYKQLNATRSMQKDTEISKQRYQAAVEGEMGGIWEFDINDNNAYLSASLAGLLGLPRREHKMPIANFLGLFHPQERNRFLEFARHSQLQGEFEFDVRVAHLPILLHCRGRHSTRSDRNFKKVIVGVAQDITVQRSAQERLRATEDRLHNALSSMTDSFAVWDPQDKLVIWNLKFEDFFNIQPGTFKPGIDHASVEYLSNQAIAKVLPHPESSTHYEIFLKDGRWIRYTQTPTADGGRVGLGTDITEIRAQKAELQDNENQLKQTVDILKHSQSRIVELAERYEQEKIRAEGANQSKNDFLARMSHELRTPLNAINGFSDIMKKEMFGPLGDPRYKEYISDILFSGQHLLTLINDILDMSKIEAGKMSLNSEIMFMHDMISQVVRIIKGRAEEAQIELDVDVQNVREIEADPRAVKQILLNILTNAIKFTPENGTVGVKIIEKRTGLIVKVTDTGIGISQENIQRLAKPFEQVEDQSSRQQEGTGLGLAISKSLVELHGGNFKIESKIGEGTTIIFSLPNKPIKLKRSVGLNAGLSSKISRVADNMAEVIEQAENFGTQHKTKPYPYITPVMPAPHSSSPLPQQLPQTQTTGRPAA
ncbi:MAG: PAS domain-containing sensor histidine kinase [Robiginitomaculum sp.]